MVILRVALTETVFESSSKHCHSHSKDISKTIQLFILLFLGIGDGIKGDGGITSIAPNRKVGSCPKGGIESKDPGRGILRPSVGGDPNMKLKDGLM